MSLARNSRYSLRKSRKILVFCNWSEEQAALFAGNMMGEKGCITLFRSFKLELTEPSVSLKNITKFYPSHVRVYQRLFELVFFYFLRRSRNYHALYHKLNTINEKIKFKNLYKLASYHYEKVIVYLDHNDYKVFADYFYPCLISNLEIKEIIIIADIDIKKFLQNYADLILETNNERIEKLKFVEPPLLYDPEKYTLCYKNSNTKNNRNCTLLFLGPSLTTELIIQNPESRINLIMVSDQDISSTPNNFQAISITDWEDESCLIFSNTYFILIDTESHTFSLEILVHALAHGAKPILILKNMDSSIYSRYFFTIESGNFKIENMLEKAASFYQSLPVDYEGIVSDFYSVNRLNSCQLDLERLA